MFAATICWSYSATILPSIGGWSVFSPVSYSRRRDGRREEQASSCRFTDRRRHGDSAHDSSYLHVGLHVPPPDLQYQPFLYRGQSAELPFCCSRRLPPYVYSKVPNTSYISLFFPGIFFFFFLECFVAFQTLPSAAAEPLARPEVQTPRRVLALYWRGVSRSGQRHHGGHRPQTVFCPVRPQREWTERGIHRSWPEGAFPGCRRHLIKNPISHKALGQRCHDNLLEILFIWTLVFPVRTTSDILKGAPNISVIVWCGWANVILFGWG